MRGELPAQPTIPELEALRLRALGYSWPETQAALGISRGSLHKRLTSLHRRLGVTELMDALRAVGWLKVPEREDLS